MPKAFAVIQSVRFDEGEGENIRVQYSVSSDNGLNFGTDILLDPKTAKVGLSDAIRQKIVDDCSTKKEPITLSDVTVFGAII
jgi:hypothetical protein